MKQKLGFDLILLGDPAAGKDTQAALLMKKYDLFPIESGKYWRQLAKSKTAAGELLRKTMVLGHPTPVKLMKQFLIDHLKKAPKSKNIIFIGNPRLKPEAQLLNKLLRNLKRDYVVIYLHLSKTQIVSRSKKRVRMHTEYDEKYIANRIKWHKRQVSKTVRYFKQIGKLHKVNGNQKIIQVNKNILTIINDHQKF